MKFLEGLFGRKGGRGPKVPPLGTQSSSLSSRASSPTLESSPPTDDTLQTGESLSKVSSETDLSEGSVIRIWHDQFGDWIPGWWCEVIRVAGGTVYLRDLKTHEEKERSLGSTLGAWKHPAPERLKALGEQVGMAHKSRMLQLRAEYEMLDFSEASLSAMVSVLETELKWKEANKNHYYDMKEEFEIREMAIVKIGEVLNQRGGFAFMQQVCADLGSPRILDMVWNGIGDWRG